MPYLETIKKKYAETMGIEQEKKKEKVSPWINAPNGWIDRNGEYLPMTAMAEHDEWAWKYLIRKLGYAKAHEKVRSLGKNAYAHEYLESAGWVRVMGWEGINKEFIKLKKLTHKQKQTIYKYCEFYKIALPFTDPLFNK